MTQEQIEQKKQLLKQTLEEAKALRDELRAAGALQLNEDELDKVAGGVYYAGFSESAESLQNRKPLFL